MFSTKHFWRLVHELPLPQYLRPDVVANVKGTNPQFAGLMNAAQTRTCSINLLWERCE